MPDHPRKSTPLAKKASYRIENATAGDDEPISGLHRNAMRREVTPLVERCGWAGRPVTFSR